MITLIGCSKSPDHLYRKRDASQTTVRVRNTTSAVAMQQDDATVASLLFYPLQDYFSSRLGPILWINVLEHDKITELLSNLQRNQVADTGGTRVRGIGRPEKCRRASCYRLKEEFSRI